MEKVFFFISKAFGLTCYSTDSTSKLITTSKFDKIWVIFWTCLWTSTAWIQIQNRLFKDVPRSESSNLQYLYAYQYTLHNVSGLIVIIFSFMKRKRVEKILKLFDVFDEKMSSIGWKSKSPAKVYKIAVILFILCLLLSLICVALTVIDHKLSQDFVSLSSVLEPLDDGFILLFFLILLEQFIIKVYCIRNKLTTLHDNLR